MQSLKNIPPSISAGDIEDILNTARREEKDLKISSAVKHYEGILDFISDLLSRGEIEPTNPLCRMFILAAERRAAISASLLYPRRKKVIKWLLDARGIAIYFDDIRLQASLELFISQTYLLSFETTNALQHFGQGYDLIKRLNDESLDKRFLKLRALVCVSEGRLLKAIEAYEDSLGNIESFDDDFSLFTAFTIALIYTEIGAPQRGIGICDAIRNQCKRDKNKPMLAFSFLLEGLIDFEIRQVNISRQCFEKALDIASGKDIPAFEVWANVGLVCIEYLEGTLNPTSRPYIFFRNMPRATWYYLPHYYTLFDTIYAVYSENISDFKDKTNLDFLDNLGEDKLYPIIHQMFQRVRIISAGNNASPTEKIKQLMALENKIRQKGSAFELAKLQIELARLFNWIHNLATAEAYAKAAWEFLSPIAPEAFPSDLRHFLLDDNSLNEERLSDLVIEMGKALSRSYNIEQLLTGIITSMSRMTKAERIAIFTKNGRVSELEMVASRNLLKEEILDKEFSVNLIDIQRIAQSGNSQIAEYITDNIEASVCRKAIITPLMLDEKNIGVLYQDSRFFPLDTSLEKIEILSALSSQIALAIDRAQAHDEIAKLNNNLLQENLYYLDEKEEFSAFSVISSERAGLLWMSSFLSAKLLPLNPPFLFTEKQESARSWLPGPFTARALERIIPLSA